MGKQPESKVVDRIGRWLNSLPRCWWFKVHGGPFQVVGVPDIVGCLNGYFFAIEVKVEGNTTSKIQDYVLRKIREAGGCCGVAYSLTEAQEILSQILSKNSRKKD